MPVVSVKTTLKMVIFFLLEKVIVVFALCEKPSLNIAGVVADLFGGCAQCIFIHGDQAGVLLLLVLVQVNDVICLGQFTFEFMNPSF